MNHFILPLDSALLITLKQLLLLLLKKGPYAVREEENQQEPTPSLSVIYEQLSVNLAVS